MPPKSSETPKVTPLPGRGLADKLRLIMVQERKAQQATADHRKLNEWIERAQKVTAILSRLDDEGEAKALLCESLVQYFTYEFAAIVPLGEASENDSICFFGATPLGKDEELFQELVEAPDIASGVKIDSFEEESDRCLTWVMSGQTRVGEAQHLLIVGRTLRMAGYYPGPWEQEQKHYRYLLGSVSTAFGGVCLRAELRRERDSLQSEVERATEQLREALVEAERARRDAVVANQAKSLFLANMSHELRTPLNAIIGYAELLMEESTDMGGEITDIFSPDLKKIHHASNHLLSLINNVLDISKIEAGKMELRPEVFNVREAIVDMWGTVQQLARKNENTLRLENCDEDASWMFSDVTKIRQILLNLLGNAAKFTEGGEISLRVTFAPSDTEDFGHDTPTGPMPSGWFFFEVEDSGIGMTESQCEEVFRPFSQATTETAVRFGGTGLGLSISRRFAELLGGCIEVQSKPGEGSLFSVRLPAVMPGALE